MEKRGFIFPWERARRWRINWRLVYMISVSAVAHATVFYLFQVSYPPVERWAPRSQEVMLLSSLDPISAQVLHDLEDRTFHLRGSGTTEVAAYSLEALTPKFRPSFATHQTVLRPVAPPPREEPLARLSDSAALVWPPLPSRDELGAEPEGAGERVTLRVVWDDGTEGNVTEWERLPGWEAEVAGAGGSWSRLRVRAGIGPDGRIMHLLDAGEERDRGRAEALGALKRSVRAAPSPEPMRWGWLELRRTGAPGR
jgi:hypothetical protein